MTSAEGMSTQEKDMNHWVALAILAVLVPVGALGHGLAVKWLWGWFVVPLGVPGLTFWHALGLGAVVAVLTPHKAKERQERSLGDLVSDGVAASVVRPAVCAGIGWLLAWAGGLL